MMRYRILLLIAPIIWGSSFVVVKDTTDSVPPSWILAVRFVIAAIILALVFLPRRSLYLKPAYIGRGCLLGAMLFSGYLLQTYGIMSTTPGKNAFLTGAYVILVPFIGWLVTRRGVTRYNVIAAVIALIGIGFVTLTGDFSIGLGDGLTLLGAIFYAIHILLVAHFAEGRDVYVLTIWQFAGAAVLALAVGLIFEPMPDWTQLSVPTIVSLGYLAVFCTAIALLFQNIGQAKVSPSSAALLLSLEAVFGVLFSILFGTEDMSVRVFIGFALIFIAIVISETHLDFLKPKSLEEGDS
ncbi:MAG: DMT family transporter [Coriobacteriaceae bacterium]|nr:DMT family transporter [Coriobacteriaceae bacterium]